ncbi:MAG: TRAP transporter small permease subunit [Tindallia sp. MSAO_Bac2]|nr:MAG: TRAP transporter small permease subunit [Tindallia sp. MSAO_Bac2]
MNIEHQSILFKLLCMGVLKLMRTFAKYFMNALAKIQIGVTAFLTIAIPLLIVFQVLLRYVFRLPLMGIEELLMFPIIWLYMLGGANASRTRSHIECGILTLYIREGTKGRAIFNMVRVTVCVLVSCWLTYWAFFYLQYALRMMKSSPLLKLPMIVAESAVFIGLALMTLYAIIELVEVYRLSIRRLQGKEQEVL